MASVDDASGGLNGAGMPQEEPLQLGQWRCSTPDLMALGVALELFGSAPMPPDLVKQAEEAVRDCIGGDASMPWHSPAGEGVDNPILLQQQGHAPPTAAAPSFDQTPVNLSHTPRYEQPHPPSLHPPSMPGHLNHFIAPSPCTPGDQPHPHRPPLFASHAPLVLAGFGHYPSPPPPTTTHPESFMPGYLPWALPPPVPHTTGDLVPPPGSTPHYPPAPTVPHLLFPTRPPYPPPPPLPAAGRPTALARAALGLGSLLDWDHAMPGQARDWIEPPESPRGCRGDAVCHATVTTAVYTATHADGSGAGAAGGATSSQLAPLLGHGITGQASLDALLLLRGDGQASPSATTQQAHSAPTPRARAPQPRRQQAGTMKRAGQAARAGAATSSVRSRRGPDWDALRRFSESILGLGSTSGAATSSGGPSAPDWGAVRRFSEAVLGLPAEAALAAATPSGPGLDTTATASASTVTDSHGPAARAGTSGSVGESGASSGRTLSVPPPPPAAAAATRAQPRVRTMEREVFPDRVCRFEDCRAVIPGTRQRATTGGARRAYDWPFPGARALYENRVCEGCRDRKCWGGGAGGEAPLGWVCSTCKAFRLEFPGWERLDERVDLWEGRPRKCCKCLGGAGTLEQQEDEEEEEA